MQILETVIEVLRMIVRLLRFGILPDPGDMKPERIQVWLAEIGEGWSLVGDGEAIVRTYVCPDAQQAIQLTRKVGKRCSELGYYPSVLATRDNEVTVQLSTSEVGRLTERDMAAAVAIDDCV